MRNFEKWIGQFRDHISDFGYFVDFEKVYKNIEKVKVELNILNSLIGSKSIENDFLLLLKKYPEISKCVPLLLAVRGYEIKVMCDGENHQFDFRYCSDVNKCSYFMRETGLFNLIANRLIGDLVDYVTGVEVGLDTNARKNRGGKSMEKVVEEHIKRAGFLDYHTQMPISKVETEYKLDLSALSNKGKSVKKFDFVIKTENCVYAVETNFYASGGSKLNETARSYKMITLQAKDIDGFCFVWITDGNGWKTAKNNLEETFDVLDKMYNLIELEDGILSRVIL
ncbi:MAG: type II restriction endonuclease [Clostridiales bacterium]|jgi:type II restriction enzyme|nr:type II restriction endonuclease [Clostridiales bacterium]